MGKALMLGRTMILLKTGARDGIEDNKNRGQNSKVTSPINTFIGQQNEIKQLQREIKKLENEKLLLVKWIHFLY